VELAADSGVVPFAVESDEALWRRSLDGDGEAFGALFDRHRDRVFRHACRLAHTRHDAEDVVASAFLELWRRRADVRLVDRSVLPWLLVTATNLGRNTARGTRRYRQFLERLPRAQDQPDVAEVALGTHALGVDARLRAGLCALNKTDAHLFVLVALEGYPVAAAAEQLELSLSAARARLHRVRTRLREQLGDYLPDRDSDDQEGTR
jgi:RNA polymerase sigma-70 factor (ECF subfamily)